MLRENWCAADAVKMCECDCKKSSNETIQEGNPLWLNCWETHVHTKAVVIGVTVTLGYFKGSQVKTFKHHRLTPILKNASLISLPTFSTFSPTFEKTFSRKSHK